jgi:hypothetical protein
MDDAIIAEFDAARAKRGKARDAALAELSKHGAALLPALLQVSSGEPASRRELALKILAGFRAQSDSDRDALVPVVDTLLGSSREAALATAVALLPQLGERVSQVQERLIAYLSWGEPALVNGALRALWELRWPDEKLAALLDPVLDHWSPDVRKAAAARLESPRRSPWDGAPVSPEVVRHLHRLGARPPAPFDPGTPRPVQGSWAMRGGSWSGADPEGSVTQMPPVAAFLDELRWPRGATFGTWDRDFPDRKVTLSGASENFDRREDGQRRLLYVIAYCSLQHYYCLDLLSPGDDPSVWNQDHEGDTPWVQFPRLSKFLGWLQQP